MALKMNKKASEWLLSTVGIAALILLVVWIVASRITSTGGSFAKETTYTQITQGISSCEADGIRLSSEGKSLNDYDDDGLPNTCDNCPFTPNSGAEVEDKDGDNFPVPIDEKYQKIWEPGDTEIRLCCGSDGIGGGNNPKALGNPEKYCETPENDMAYGPKELILPYINLKKS